MKKVYSGVEIDENNKILEREKFVAFGQMSDGSLCYHKVVDGKEVEDRWYSRTRRNGCTYYFLEGLD